jgi:hypothetical protein
MNDSFSRTYIYSISQFAKPPKAKCQSLIGGDASFTIKHQGMLRPLGLGIPNCRVSLRRFQRYGVGANVDVILLGHVKLLFRRATMRVDKLCVKMPVLG